METIWTSIFATGTWCWQNASASETLGCICHPGQGKKGIHENNKPSWEHRIEIRRDDWICCSGCSFTSETLCRMISRIGISKDKLKQAPIVKTCSKQWIERWFIFINGNAGHFVHKEWQGLNTCCPIMCAGAWTLLVILQENSVMAATHEQGQSRSRGKGESLGKQRRKS